MMGTFSFFRATVVALGPCDWYGLLGIVLKPSTLNPKI